MKIPKPWKPDRFGPEFYVLRGKLAVPIKDPLQWGMEFENSQRIVKQTEFQNAEPWLAADTLRHKESAARHKKLGMSVELDEQFMARIILVSTVFLGLNMRFGPGDPLLFETMIFNGPLEGEQNRWCSWVEAETGHAEYCLRVKEALIAKAREDVEIKP